MNKVGFSHCCVCQSHLFEFMLIVYLVIWFVPFVSMFTITMVVVFMFFPPASPTFKFMLFVNINARTCVGQWWSFGEKPIFFFP